MDAGSSQLKSGEFIYYFIYFFGVTVGDISLTATKFNCSYKKWSFGPVHVKCVCTLTFNVSPECNGNATLTN